MANNSFRRPNDTKSAKKFKESAKHLALEFGRKSTIHAMNRIFQEHSNLFERSFWICILVLALFGCIYVCLILSQRFNDGSLQTVVDTTNKPVYEIYFPEVTVCNGNHLNWNRIEEAKKRFLPNENNTETLQIFERVIGLYDHLEYGKFHEFSELKGERLHLVNHVNFSLVFDFMTWRCAEILTDCVWHHFEINCCEIFVKSKSLNGICWHFNTISTVESRHKMLADVKYPWRSGSAGPKSGLNLRILINEDKHYHKDDEKGAFVSIMEPGVFHTDPYWIPADTETVLEVNPIIYFYDNGTRYLSSTSRKCLFTDENPSEGLMKLPNFNYMFENCETQCRQKHLLRYCNCTMDLLFPPANYRSCQAEDLLCLAKHNAHFRFVYQFGEEKYVKCKVKGMVCKCVRNCYSLNYYTNLRSAFLPKYLRDNITYIDLDVHFRFVKLLVYRTSLVFNWVDLMVAFGGIAGLFLGCSLISGIELLYFTFVELPTFLFRHLKFKRKNTKMVKLYHNELDSAHMSRKRSNWTLNNRIRDAQNMPENTLRSYEKNLDDKYNCNGTSILYTN